MGKLKEVDEKNTFQIRTDLAIEARELIQESQEKKEDEPNGVKVETQEGDCYTLTRVSIINDEGSKAMGKPKGEYITIESQKLKENAVDCHEEIIKLLAEQLRKLAKTKEEDCILVAGLGNWNITPDALGPKVISRILVTRHLQGSLPVEIEGTVRPVAAISPGVMGLTGIETGEIIKGLVEKVKPTLLIAIDALAARRSSRINATIQMSDTGVAPGAGVGNKRMMLSQETLGIPVIAIGVPTVVDAATLVNDTMDRILASMIEQTKKGTDFYRMLQDLEEEEKYTMITEILDPYTENMFVTPKEVDAVIDRLSNIIANGINIALHPGITMEDISKYS
ncbi:MAG: GPR endopeptidase [Anaerotignum propionicum]|uniref:GPR endopeptidase n=1 Tax=Anaerotignum propionicum TaxID=28446 RepID=UPI002B2173AA|nr:GPR endopeptidase [Anaerotignum propionicum]MEA5057506.1 GPR endopeptidase [Anaerotignum propionicum]